MPVNSISICSIMIIIFTHIKFSRIYGPARNARKYVPRENFYVYSNKKQETSSYRSKEGARITRTVNTYVFDTQIVYLSIYANSPYYVGVCHWNDLPNDIRTVRDKHIFNRCLLTYLA